LFAVDFSYQIVKLSPQCSSHSPPLFSQLTPPPSQGVRTPWCFYSDLWRAVVPAPLSRSRGCLSALCFFFTLSFFCGIAAPPSTLTGGVWLLVVFFFRWVCGVFSTGSYPPLSFRQALKTSPEFRFNGTLITLFFSTPGVLLPTKNARELFFLSQPLLSLLRRFFVTSPSLLTPVPPPRWYTTHVPGTPYWRTSRARSQIVPLRLSPFVAGSPPCPTHFFFCMGG